MSERFESMSVIELRQKAKEMGVKLGAGINKQGIVAKLKEAAEQMGKAVPQAEPERAPAAEAPSRPIRSAAIITDDEEAEEEDVPVLTPNPILQAAPRSAPRPANPVPTGAAAPSGSSLSTISAKAPAFTMEGSRAWHNPRAYQGANTFQRNPAAPQGWAVRSAQPVPGEQRSYGGRPAAPQHMDSRGPQSRPAQQPSYVNRFGPEQTMQEPEQRPAEYRSYAAPAQQDYSAPRENSASQGNYGYAQPAYPRRETNMGIAEILAAGDCGDGEGILEVHPEGYGFLRTNHYLPGKQDVYISNAQIRRFNLRTGDLIAGKTRAQREPDRYSAMLYITEVNGAAPEEMPTRPRFEDLTPIYPKKRITLTGKRENDPLLRLIDVLCPIGFGQRAMVVCGPRVDRLALLKKLGAAINRNYSKAQMMLLLVDERPEEVTEIREAVKAEVIYSTFDDPADSQIRVTELALERAMRMVEQKKDVIILADSLTRLARACNVIAPQTARTMGGGLAAGALNKPKRFFGAARNTREAGSLTIIATITGDTVNELDQAILREFRGNSNMSCAFLRGKNGQPVMQVSECGTIHDEWLQTEEERKLAERLRAETAGMQPEEAMEKLLNDMAEHETNEGWSSAEAGESQQKNE